MLLGIQFEVILLLERLDTAFFVKELYISLVLYSDVTPLWSNCVISITLYRNYDI